MGLVVAVVMPQLQCRPAHFKERFVHTHPAQKHRVTSPRLPVAEVDQFFLLLLSFFPLLSTCVFFLFPRLGCCSFDLLVLICRRDLQSLALVVLADV